MSFVLALPWLSYEVLYGASAFLAFWGLSWGRAHLWRYLARIWVLLFALILLYAYATPGVPAFAEWGHYAPSMQGLESGSLQAWRLVLVVASLAFALSALRREALLAAIYSLLTPFRGLGLPVERLSVRLWLTLHYAERPPVTRGLGARWDAIMQSAPTGPQQIPFEVPAFNARDVIFIGCCLLALGLAIW